MRTPMAVGLLAAALLAAPARADDAPTVTLEVGQTYSAPGHSGRCDDLAVATITVNGVTITALKPGRTVCGWAYATSTARTWVNVVVVPRKDGEKPAPGGDPAAPAPPAR